MAPLRESVRKAQSARGETGTDAQIHGTPEPKPKRTAAAKTTKKATASTSTGARRTSVP